MITATEVGGDYYDFDVDDSGGLTVAVGDAIGHGARAGTLVAATKSLFSATRAASRGSAPGSTPGCSSSTVEAMLDSFDDAIQHMQMERAFVALLLARFRGSHLEVASAGMAATSRLPCSAPQVVHPTTT